MNTTNAVRKAFRIQRYRRRYDDMFDLRTRESISAIVNEQFALQRKQYAKDNQGWVTIGGSAGDGGKQHVGGTPVQIGEGGKIESGPASLKGKTIGSVTKGDDDFQLKRPRNKPSNPKETQKQAFETIGPPDSASSRLGGIDAPSVQTLSDGRKVGLTMLSTAEMAADPARFQYKVSGIGSEGVTEELKEVDQFRPEFAGQLLVWHDPKDGQSYVVNGHHRFELAQRSGFEGQIPTYLIDAKDEKEARALGALANIAEGRGTAVDAAKFFRESGLGVDELKGQGVSMKGKMADEGVSLAKLSDNAFRAMVNGQLSEKRGLAITRHLEDRDKQDELLHNIRQAEQRGHHVRDDAVEEMARDLSLSESVIEEQTDLFGTEEVKRSLVVERGMLKAAVRRALSSESRAFTEVGRRGRPEALAEAGNVIDTEGNKRRAQAAQQLLATFDRESKYVGEINDVINEHSGRLADEPKREKQLARELNKRIRSLLSETDGGTKEATGGTSGRDTANREANGPNTDRTKFGLRESLERLMFSKQVFSNLESLRYRKFDESKVKRDGEGKFSSGGGGPTATESKPSGFEKTNGSTGGGLGIKREDMPQIKGEDKNEFFRWLAKQGIMATSTQKSASELKPTQSDLNVDKVEQMAQSIRDGGYVKGTDPLVSSNGYVLDGHHRWGAYQEADPDHKFNVRVIDLPIRELLDTVRAFPKSLKVSTDGVRTKYQQPWDESKHPRADDGKFGSGGSAKKPEQDGSAIPSKGVDFTETSRQYPPINPSGKDTEQRYLRPDGTYTPERQQLHDEIVRGIMEGVTPSDNPTVYMLGGGTAAGKSTMVRRGLVTLPDNAASIDSDYVKSNLPEYQTMIDAGDSKAAAFAHEESSYVSKKAVSQATSQGFDVVMDGTGDSGIENLRAKVQRWRKDGHRIVASYATVPTETAIERSVARAKKTGRDVPLKFIKDVHRTISQILPQAIEEGLFDEMKLFDNSTGESQLVVSAQGNQLQIHNQQLWNDFLAKGR